MFLATCFLSLTLPGLALQEPSPAEAAERWLASLTEIRSDLLGEQTLVMRMLGVPIGSTTLDLRAGEHGGQPCYVFHTEGSMTLGDWPVMWEETLHVSPDLKLLRGDLREWENKELVEHFSYRLEDTTYHLREETWADPKGDPAVLEWSVALETRLLMGGVNILAARLLANEERGPMEFLKWKRDADEVVAFLVTVGAEEELGGQACRRVTELETIGEGKVDTSTGSPPLNLTFWISEARYLQVQFPAFVQMDVLPDPPRTPISMDQVRASATPKAVAGGMMLALQTNDRDLLLRTADMLRFTRTSLDRDPRTRDQEASKKDGMAVLIQSNVIDAMLRSAQERNGSERERRRMIGMWELLLHEELLESREHGGFTYVRPAGELGAMFGDVVFQVDRHGEDQWRVIWLLSRQEAAELVQEVWPER